MPGFVYDVLCISWLLPLGLAVVLEVLALEVLAVLMVRQIVTPLLS